MDSLRFYYKIVCLIAKTPLKIRLNRFSFRNWTKIAFNKYWLLYHVWHIFFDLEDL